MLIYHFSRSPEQRLRLAACSTHPRRVAVARRHSPYALPWSSSFASFQITLVAALPQRCFHRPHSCHCNCLQHRHNLLGCVPMSPQITPHRRDRRNPPRSSHLCRSLFNNVRFIKFGQLKRFVELSFAKAGCRSVRIKCLVGQSIMTMKDETGPQLPLLSDSDYAI